MGKRDYRPTVFGHSLQAPYINALVLDTVLRINETTKYKDAAKGINDGQGNLNKWKSELIGQLLGIWDNLWKWREHWIMGAHFTRNSWKISYKLSAPVLKAK